jgi:hypothetical protein
MGVKYCFERIKIFFGKDPRNIENEVNHFLRKGNYDLCNIELSTCFFFEDPYFTIIIHYIER